MEGAINELIGNHEVGRFVLFLQRAYSGDGENAFDPKLLQAQDIRSKVQLTGKNPMPPAMPRQKCHLATFQSPENVSIRRAAKRRLQIDLMNVGKAGHGIQATAPNNANFSLLQKKFLLRNVYRRL